MPDGNQSYCDVCDEWTVVPRTLDEGTEFESETYNCENCDACLCDDCVVEREETAERDSYEDDEDYVPDDGERETVRVSEEVVANVTAAPSLYLPNLTERPIRLMSFEQEVARGWHEVAASMYDHGFSPWSELEGYGSSRMAEREHADRDTFVHVEADSSCGGEVIYSKLDLADPHAAGRFEDAFGLVRRLHADDVVMLNMTCGFHVHVDIQGFGMRAIENLYHAHNFLEDVLFRIGSANWRVHRTEVADTDYAPTVAKSLRGKPAIGRWFESSRSALNLSNYLASRGSCHCGAFAFADWESCECTLPKSTVEFRWPNATTNARKVHAYAALLQALVARAAIAEDGEFRELPACEFRGTAYTPRMDDVAARVAWLSSELVLTDSERDSVAYCLSRAKFPYPDTGRDDLGDDMASIMRGARVTA